jgi:hypothetical protein
MDKVTVDSKIIGKPGVFDNDIFIQSLLPKNHTVLVEKAGYYNYSKTLPVKENEVTKIENILLIKKDIAFTDISALSTTNPFVTQDKYIIKTGNLYYSNSPENATLTATQKSTSLIKKILAFTLQNNDIIWLGADGILYKSQISALTSTPTPLTQVALKITKGATYSIIAGTKEIFVNNNANLMLLDQKNNVLVQFAENVKIAKVSDDNKTLVYSDGNSIFVSPILVEGITKNLLYKSSEKIGDIFWLNNDNIIFTSGNKIIISEIDYRGNINSVTLPQTFEKPQIAFDQQSGKLYIKTGATLLLSEKILP